MIKRILIVGAALASVSAFAKDAPEASPFVLSSLDGSITIASDQIQSLRTPTNARMTMETPEGNVASVDAFGTATNCVAEFDIGANNTVTGSSFDVRIESIGASWLSEATVDFTDSAISTGVALTPGIGNDAAGADDFTSAGLIDLVALSLDFSVGADGILRFEFYETFVDVAGAPEANWFNLPPGVGDFGLTFECSDQAACDAGMAAGAVSTSGQCDGFDFSLGNGVEIPEFTPVPVNNIWALSLLVLLLAGLGVFVIRRMA